MADPAPRVLPRLLRLALAAVPALIAFGLAGLFLARIGSISGPEAVFPIGIAVLVLVLGLVNLIRDATAQRRDTDTAGRNDGAAERSAGGSRRTVAFVVVLVAAVLLLDPLGFFPAMTAMVIGSLLVFGERNPLVVAAATALMIGWAYLLFVRLLLVPFPAGFLGLV